MALPVPKALAVPLVSKVRAVPLEFAGLLVFAAPLVQQD